MSPKCLLNWKLGLAQDRSGNLVKFCENLHPSGNEIFFFIYALRSLVSLVSQHVVVLFRAFVLGSPYQKYFSMHWKDNNFSLIYKPTNAHIISHKTLLKVFYVKLYVHSLVYKFKWFYENARCYSKIYNRFSYLSKCSLSQISFFHLQGKMGILIPTLFPFKFKLCQIRQTSS